MEGGESPLDVLSRAATMVQENQQTQNNSTDETAKQSCNKQLPTTKWKRDRRSKLPEYSRKSDPKIPETFSPQESSSNSSVEPASTHGGSSSSSVSSSSSQQQQQESWNAPLDMSINNVKHNRGSPPTYSQTVNNPGYRSNYKLPNMQTNAPSRDDLPPGISMCDPIIDEHFRRSLGNDYLALFSNNNVSKEALPVRPAPNLSGTPNVIELMDTAGLSVDDHFAKALGDTWVKLNKKEQEIKNSSNENHSLVSI